MGPANALEVSVPAEEGQRVSPARAAPFRGVAACVDGSRISETVVLHAAKVAAAFGVPLTILRVLEPDSQVDAAPPDPLDWDVRQREARASLEQLVSLGASHGAHVQSALVQGRAAEQICCWAMQHGVDLIALSSHGEHGRCAWTLSGPARKLVDGVPGSLLLIPADGGGHEAAAAPYRRVMVPLDGSARAESVLPVATRLATVHQADVLLAHVIPTPELTKVGPLTAQDLELEQRVVARNERVARGYLDQIRARMSDAGVARSIISRGGDARTLLARLVRREGVDVLILSAYGRRGPRDTPCGSVATYLLTHVAVPVLLFRERPRRILERARHEATAQAASARPPAQATS